MIENFRLRVFRAVVQHLNFSRAAEELLLTQPAVTQQIKALEDEFGVPLFERGGGRSRLAYFLIPTRLIPTLKRALVPQSSTERQ